MKIPFILGSLTMGWFIKAISLLVLISLVTSLAQAKILKIQVAMISANPNRVEPLNQVQIVDSQGRAWRSNKNGFIQLAKKPDQLFVVLNHPGFEIESRINHTPIPITFNTEKVATIPYSPEAAAFVSLEKAHRYLSEGNSQGLIPQNKKLQVVFLNEPGCNALFFKNKLFIDSGNNQCHPPGTSTSLVIHEYGHFIYENFLHETGSTLLSESFGDLLAAFVTTNPHVGAGLWKHRHIHWLRNISEVRRYPDHFRGTYSGSQIFSSLFWEAFQQKQYNPLEGKNLLLKFIDVSRQFHEASQRENLFTEMGSLLAELTPHDSPFQVSLFKRGLTTCATCDVKHGHQTLFASKRPFIETVIVDKKIELKSKVSLPFELTLPNQIKPTDLSVRLKGSCSSSEHLQVLYRPSQAAKYRDVYIGQEELPFPNEVHLESLTNKNQFSSLSGSIAFRVLDKIFSGRLETASIRVYFEPPVPTLGITPLIPGSQQ